MTISPWVLRCAGSPSFVRNSGDTEPPRRERSPWFRRASVLAAAVALVWAGSSLHADSLYLELSARGERMDIGLSPGRAEPGLENGALWAQDADRTLKRDLEFTGLFSLIEGGPRYEGSRQAAEWSRLGADVVSAVSIEKNMFGRPQLSGVLYDSSSGQAALSKKFLLDGDARRAAHQWSDEIVRYFTGRPGIASSRIVFVNDATGHKEVCLIDADGGRFQQLTRDRSIALFPKLSPAGDAVVYTTFRGGRPEIYHMRSDGRDARPLCRFEGLNSAAAWTPDGRFVVATLSRGGAPNLCLVDLEGRVVRALTQSPAADTAPSVSPDGLRLAFTSDRTGVPQIHTMTISGSDLRRAFRGPIADSPDWSPLGHLVAFTTQDKNYFDIWTWEVSTGRLQRLTYGEGDNENASWSPDGRHLVYTSTRGDGRRRLWVMNADGSHARPLGDIPGRSFTPHWGR